MKYILYTYMQIELYYACIIELCHLYPCPCQFVEQNRVTK